MKKKMICLLIAATLVAVCVWYHIRGSPVSSFCRMPSRVLVIDAGHGGEDGGAVAISGTPESQVNLSIALKSDQLCGLFGVSTYLLRDSDVSLADEDANSIRQKKRSDLMNRVKVVNETENAVLLSIHQNNFSNRASHGAQVFFHDDTVSEHWAVQMQELFRSVLDESNQRKATQIPETVYLMNHISCRAVLVECGFLSNPEEDTLLETEPYQTKLAAIMVASYLTYNDNGIAAQGATIQ